MNTTRDEYLKYCTGFTFVLSLMSLYACLWSLDTGIKPGILLVSSVKPFLWTASGLLIAAVVLTAVLRKISTSLAGCILCLCVSASIFTILAHYSNSYSLLAFVLPILFSIFLFDWKQVCGFVGLILISSLYLNQISFKEASLQDNYFIPVLLVLFVSAFLLLLFNNLTSTIDWYAEKYESAHRNEQIIRDNEAKLERLVKSLNDYEKYLRITNEMLGKARDEAEEARNVKQIFVQNVSHELRTPLNLIIGFSETMINTPQEYGEVNWTPELKGDIECIFQNSQHLKALIDDVLDLAALENKKYEIDVADIDINTLIREAVLSAEVSFSSKGLYLKTDFSEEILMVRADLVRIKQVILNLLSNALKYTRRGGVVISSRRDNGMARVTVRDTGKGIPEDALEKVFEAFYQVDKSSSREDSGTGLGLSISKQLIHLHGGEMKIESAVGKGTNVSFTVPISK